MQLREKSAVVRVESEETKDYAWEWRWYRDLSQEEGGDISFVPRAVGEHWCDNQCSENGFKFHQFAAMVTEDGGEAGCWNTSPSRERGPGHLSGCREREAGRHTREVATESLFKEVLEQIKRHSAFDAVKAGGWEGFKEALRDKGEISEWAFA